MSSHPEVLDYSFQLFQRNCSLSFSWFGAFASCAWNKTLHSTLVSKEDLYSLSFRQHSTSILVSIKQLLQELIQDAASFFFSPFLFVFVTHTWGFFCGFSWCCISFFELAICSITWLTIGLTLWVTLSFLNFGFVQHIVSLCPRLLYNL